METQELYEKVDLPEIALVEGKESKAPSFGKWCGARILRSATHAIFTNHVLIYLSSAELARTSQCSNYFRNLASEANLWKEQFERDFTFVLHNNNNKSASAQRPLAAAGGARGEEDNELVPPGEEAVVVVVDSLSSYAQHYKDVMTRVEKAKRDKEESLMDLKRISQVARVQKFLDCTQVRLLTPLPMTTIFLSLLLLTLKLDGYRINIWACAAPLLFFFFYVFFCMLVARCVYTKQFDTTSLYRGLWTNLRGPIRLMFREALGESPRLACIAIVALLLCLAQVVLVAIKLSPSSIIATQPPSFSWGVVLIPMWCLFCIYCVSPATGCITEFGAYLTGCALLWIPLFIFFVCLAVKLGQKEQNHSSSNNIRLALIFIPFWLIEGTFLASSFSFLVIGIIRFRAGFLERIDEHIGIFMAVWCTIAPFVIFQSFLCARDDYGDASTVSNTAAVSPMLIVSGWLLLCAVSYALRVRTPYQETREQIQQAAAGTIVLYDV